LIDKKYLYTIRMKFCEVCENLYYLKISEEDNSLHYYCRKCGNTEQQTSSECIKEVTYTKDNQTDQNINTYLKYDPTIPYSNQIKCPNNLCDTNQSKEVKPKVIYYRYDEQQLKYMYMCTICDSSWKS